MPSRRSVPWPCGEMASGGAGEPRRAGTPAEHAALLTASTPARPRPGPALPSPARRPEPLPSSAAGAPRASHPLNAAAATETAPRCRTASPAPRDSDGSSAQQPASPRGEAAGKGGGAATGAGRPRGLGAPQALQPGRSCRWRRAAEPRSQPLSAAQQSERATLHLGGVFFSLSVTAGLPRYPREMRHSCIGPGDTQRCQHFSVHQRSAPRPPARLRDRLSPAQRRSSPSPAPAPAPLRPQPRSGPARVRRSAAQPSRRADANPCRALTSAPAPPSSVTARAVGDALR